MPQLVITTVGTSIIDKYVRVDNPAKNFYENEIEGKEIEGYTSRVERFKADVTEFVRKSFDSDITKAPSDTDNRLSAEIASLWIMQKNDVINLNDDKIALLHSDTLEGKLAADINEEILRDKAGFSNISQGNLPGIRGRDASSFNEAIKNDGISNILRRIVDSSNYDSSMICFSGGYKGLVPALSGFAISSEKIDMYYLFEKSDSVVHYKYTVEDGKVSLTTDRLYE